MKNQYFGDNRDLFKYDLIQTILTESNYVRNFLFIAMLTSDDNSTEGSKINYRNAKAGFSNNSLVNHLLKSIRTTRNINQIVPYFKQAGHTIEIIDEKFTNIERSQYFDKVVNRSLDNSLIFFDPDNGLEVRHNNEKHLLFSEIFLTLEKNNEDNLLMLYQHFPRVKRKKYIENRQSEIQLRLGLKSLYISDNEIVFFFITKQEKIFSELQSILSNYNQKYPKLLSSTSHLIESKQRSLFTL